MERLYAYGSHGKQELVSRWFSSLLQPLYSKKYPHCKERLAMGPLTIDRIANIHEFSSDT